MMRCYLSLSRPPQLHKYLKCFRLSSKPRDFGIYLASCVFSSGHHPFIISFIEGDEDDQELHQYVSYDAQTKKKKGPRRINLNDPIGLGKGYSPPSNLTVHLSKIDMPELQPKNRSKSVKNTKPRPTSMIVPPSGPLPAIPSARSPPSPHMPSPPPSKETAKQKKEREKEMERERKELEKKEKKGKEKEKEKDKKKPKKGRSPL